MLDATVDPIALSGTGAGDAASTTPLGVRERQGIGASETFREFARLCRDGGPELCPLAVFGDPAVVVPTVFDRLARKPVEMPLPDGTTAMITQQVAVAATFASMSSPMTWPQFADFLAALAAPVPSPARIAGIFAGIRSLMATAFAIRISPASARWRVCALTRWHPDESANTRH